MKKIFKLILILIFVLSITGCSFLKDVDEAKLVVDDFYSKLKEGNYDGIIAISDNQLLEVTPEDKFKQFLQTIDEKLGKVETYGLYSYNVQKKPTGKSTVTLVYSTNRTIYPSMDTFILTRSRKGTEFKVLGYNLNSEGLLQ